MTQVVLRLRVHRGVETSAKGVPLRTAVYMRPHARLEFTLVLLAVVVHPQVSPRAETAAYPSRGGQAYAHPFVRAVAPPGGFGPAGMVVSRVGDGTRRGGASSRFPFQRIP